MKANSNIALATELRIYGMAETLEKRIAEANADSLTANEFITRLLEDEVLYRKNSKAILLEKKATFRRKVIIEKLETNAERGLSKTKLRELATLNFWHSKKNLIIVGPTGVGKTELSLALGRVACQNQLTVQFMSVENLFNEVQAHKASGRLQFYSKKLKSTDILILDDFGLRNYSHEEAIYLMSMLEDRYKEKIQIITSQVNTSDWKSLFSDPVVAEALLDRIENPSEKIVLSGKSYRTG